MERDFRKLTKWIEEALRTGVPDEQRLFELKLAERIKPPAEESPIIQVRPI